MCQGCFPVISFPIWDWWKQSSFLFQEGLTYSWQQPPRQMSHKRGCPWALCVWPIYQCPGNDESLLPEQLPVPCHGTPLTGSSLHQSLFGQLSRGLCPQCAHPQLVYSPFFQGCCQALLMPWKDLHWVPVISKHSGHRELWQLWLQGWCW